MPAWTVSFSFPPFFVCWQHFFFCRVFSPALFFSFSYSSLGSPSEFASDSLTFATVKLHTKWRDPVIDGAVLSLCQVRDIICVTDVWLPCVYVVWAARRQRLMSFCISSRVLKVAKRCFIKGEGTGIDVLWASSRKWLIVACFTLWQTSSVFTLECLVYCRLWLLNVYCAWSINGPNGDLRWVNIMWSTSWNFGVNN